MFSFLSELFVSVVLWIDPLLLVPFGQVMGAFVGCLREVLERSVVGRIVVQVLLSDWQGLELLHSVVVVRDLGERERLLVHCRRMHQELGLFESSLLDLVSHLHCSLEVLLVQSHGKLLQLLVQLLQLLGVGSLLLCLLSFRLFGCFFSLLLVLSLELLRFFGLLCCFCWCLLFSLSFGCRSLLSFSFGFGLCLCFLLVLDLSFLLILNESLLLDSFFLLDCGLLGHFHLLQIFSLLLLLDLQHLKLSLSLSSFELMLSLQSSKVCFGSCFLCSSSLCLLDSLSCEELLLFLLCLSFLSSLFLLKKLELFSSLLSKNFFFLSLFLSFNNLLFEIHILLELFLSLLLLSFELFEQLCLLSLLFLLKLNQSFISRIRLWERLICLASESNSLLVCLFSSFLECLLHCCEFLSLVCYIRLLDALNWDYDTTLLGSSLDISLIVSVGLLLLFLSLLCWSSSWCCRLGHWLRHLSLQFFDLFLGGFSLGLSFINLLVSSDLKCWLLRRGSWVV